jgi:hypothetical protein
MCWYAAVAGFVATTAMTWCVATGRRLAAARLLVIAVVLYAAWAVLLDADTHGWATVRCPVALPEERAKLDRSVAGKPLVTGHARGERPLDAPLPVVGSHAFRTAGVVGRLQQAR